MTAPRVRAQDDPRQPMALPIDAPDVQRRLDTERARLLLAAGRWVWPLHLVSAVVVLWTLWPVGRAALLVAWAAIMATAAVLQGGVCIAALRPAAGEDFLRAARRFDATALVLGLAWGFLGSVLLPIGDRERQFFIGFLMSGAALVGVGTQHMRTRTLLLSLLPSFPLFVLRQALAEPALGALATGMLALFLGTMLGLARLLHGFVTRLLRLQLEQDRLLARLSQQARDLAAARAAADEANVAKSRFLAQASHDLRQPLHAIGLLLESLPEQPFDERSARATRRIRQSLDELSELFDALLDVTLLDTGQVKVARRTVRLGDLLTRARDDLTGTAAARGVALRVVPTRALVDTDPIIVRRVLHNLVANAMQHSGGRRVLVGARRRRDGLVLQVCDDGRGIASADQQRIFTEFTRLAADRPGPRPAAGLGLGLSIVKRLGDILGLDVTLRSAPGRGATFAVGILPRVREAHAAAASAAPPPPLGVARVLVIDDDGATRDATASLLRKWGCAVDARADWSGGPSDGPGPDLVICDWALGPERVALDAIAEIRACYGANLPAVVVTGDSSVAARARLAAAGLPVLHKPVRPAQLRSAMLHAVARSAEATG